MAQETALQVTQIIFLALLAIPSLIVLGGVVYASKIIMPTVLSQMQQMIDNNRKLTDIAKQNADQIKSAEDILASIAPELVKQTNAIEAQVVEARTQRLDFRNYQKLIDDGILNQVSKIEANTARVANLEIAFADLPQKIIAAIQDELVCKNILTEVQSLRSEVSRVIFQQQRSTGTFPSVPKQSPDSEPNNS